MTGSRQSGVAQNRRVAVTGIGVVSPIGVGLDSFWRQLVAGESGIDYLTAFPCDLLPTRLAAEVKNFDLLSLAPNKKKFLKVMSRDVQLGVGAATLAMKNAALSTGAVAPERLGVVFGAGRMSPDPQQLLSSVSDCPRLPNGELDLRGWGGTALEQVAPLWLIPQLPNMAACHISIDFDAQGPNNTITCREASALLALEEAVNVVRRGAADAMIVGACGSSIHPVDIAKLSLFDGLSKQNEDPEHACRPFDFERDGTIVGEGSAAFVVEEYDHAVQRGADIYAEILGVGAGCDGYGFANEAAGTGLVRAMQAAIKSSFIDPSELGHINAHGKSTQRDDLVESRAYHRALGTAAEKVPVTAMKSYFGHCDAGGGAIELAGSLLSLRNRELPRTLNYHVPDPRCRINVIHEQTFNLRSSTAMTVNRTAAGQSVAAIFRAA
ncbi:beta-ketoacyl-[acyl-carrier-protein] synthase family protein [Calycomorphotria hydatis]|uniref:3-oxoacyl-[acyl-carrier-protein] synthase 2 n=1 Tax=Calycomorphotria hydatis TaxID=2528027 RepID=A0A517T6F2_9PLAN|nr:beta-ketoacyl-[acyl-carrier-protein] synthase family protein [Calycomorphotria hydatis]QDT63954.1 3-oxoacyl-[acyl-carrier-protein] synthase 2 [Calycomorphotria hydatis]